MNESAAKLQEILKDESFGKALLAADSPETVQKMLEEKGVSLSLDEISEVGELISRIASGEITEEQLRAAGNGELSEEDLEQVAGGDINAVTALGIIIAGVLGTAGLLIDSAVESNTGRHW